jgi:hypothetical protein
LASLGELSEVIFFRGCHWKSYKRNGWHHIGETVSYAFFAVVAIKELKLIESEADIIAAVSIAA